MEFTGPIFMIQKVESTSFNLLVYLKLVLKGSKACRYLEISPNFGLKEHYIPEPH